MVEKIKVVQSLEPEKFPVLSALMFLSVVDICIPTQS